MKKILSFVVICGLLAAILVGATACGSKEEVKEQASSVAEVVTDAAAEKVEEVSEKADEVIEEVKDAASEKLDEVAEDAKEAIDSATQN